MPLLYIQHETSLHARFEAKYKCQTAGNCATTKTCNITYSEINTFEYHVSCTDGKISVRIITYFSTVVPFNSCVFLSCSPFIVNTTFSTDLVGCWSFFYLSSDRRSFKTQRPIENAVITMKDLQERKTQLLNGTTVKKVLKNKLSPLTQFNLN